MDLIIPMSPRSHAFFAHAIKGYQHRRKNIDTPNGFRRADPYQMHRRCDVPRG
jgi:hypothetical protein